MSLDNKHDKIFCHEYRHVLYASPRRVLLLKICEY